ncbi:MAG: YkoF family thiamine/hydroxymethylpyrimidine-binding protein [Oscillospiraceae bacterium]|jgi:uncharacterized protein YqgV (UPF0045/DUF77 family)
MKVQVQISIYPLRTETLSEPIGEFCRILKGKGLKVQTQTMDSLVIGESDIVFESVRDAFEQIAEKYNIVMDFKVSNACPKEVEKRVKKEQI